MADEKDNSVLSNDDNKKKQAFLSKLGGKKEPIVLETNNNIVKVDIPVEKEINSNEEIKQKVEETEKPKKKLIKITTPLGEKEIKINKDEVLKIENSEKLLEVAKEYGIQVDSLEKVAGIFKEYKDIKENYSKTSKEYKVIKEEYESQVRFLNGLDPVFQSVFAEYIKETSGDGGNWKALMKTISSLSLDYNKDVDAYSDLQLVNEFSKKKYTKEDWEDLLEEDKEEKLENAKSKYITNQKNILDNAVRYRQDKANRQQRISLSIEESLVELKNKLQKEGINLTDDKVDELRVQMSGGFVRDLYNEDGTFKKEAAEKIVYGRYGKEFINSYDDYFAQMDLKIKEETNKAINTTTENIIKNGSQTAPSETSATEVKKVPNKSELEKKMGSVIENINSKKNLF